MTVRGAETVSTGGEGVRGAPDRTRGQHPPAPLSVRTATALGNAPLSQYADPHRVTNVMELSQALRTQGITHRVGRDLDNIDHLTIGDLTFRRDFDSVTHAPEWVITRA